MSQNMVCTGKQLQLLTLMDGRNTWLCITLSTDSSGKHITYYFVLEIQGNCGSQEHPTHNPIFNILPLIHLYLSLRIIEDCPLATLRATTDGLTNPHVQNLMSSITRPLYMECTYMYTSHKPLQWHCYEFSFVLSSIFCSATSNRRYLHDRSNSRMSWFQGLRSILCWFLGRQTLSLWKGFQRSSLILFLQMY